MSYELKSVNQCRLTEMRLIFPENDRPAAFTLINYIRSLCNPIITIILLSITYILINEVSYLSFQHVNKNRLSKENCF